MTDTTSTRPQMATPHEDLIAQIMDSRRAKNEREWAAAREIEKLRASLHKPGEADEIKRLSSVIERDRSQCAEILTEVRKAIRGHEWLRLGRGSYEYNDERWKDEFGEAIEGIEEALKPLAALARDWSDCPTKREEILTARASLPHPTAGSTVEVDACRDCGRTRKAHETLGWECNRFQPRASTPAQSVLVEAFGWLIETAASQSSAPQYWGGCNGWTVSDADAVRFSRKEDAESAAKSLDEPLSNFRIKEHGWG